jgi:3-phosphoshikimate 1-carboxyvinyltransferase
MLILAALAEGESLIQDLNLCDDVLSTTGALQSLGVSVKTTDHQTLVSGVGFAGLQSPAEPIDVGNSGTTLRLLTGVLSGAQISATLTGDTSLLRRPMERVAEPLRGMGAKLSTLDGRAPVKVEPSLLSGCEIELKVASAQVKSALLMAGLFARGQTRLTGKVSSRDHTEILLQEFGVHVEQTPGAITIEGCAKLSPAELNVPRDFSAAAPWLILKALLPESAILLPEVNLNPTRTGLLAAFKRAGFGVDLHRVRKVSGEEVGEVEISAPAGSRPFELRAQEISALIDELPLLALFASQLNGESRFCGVEELVYKESDRLTGVINNLSKMGAEVTVDGEDLIVCGPHRLKGGNWKSEGDHRMAIAGVVAGLIAASPIEVDDCECIAISYPGFFNEMQRIGAKVEEVN